MTRWEVSIAGVERAFDAEIVEQHPDDIQIDRDLHRFTELVEEQGFETGTWRGDVDRSADATGR